MCVILSVAALLTSAAGCSRKSNKNEKVLKQLMVHWDFPEMRRDMETLIQHKI